MTDIKVTFVLPNDIEDESKASDVMKQAYNSCKELVKDTFWDKESNLVNRNLTKKDFLVFEELEGKDFSIYSESQCAIVGPLALNVCLSESISIPNFPWPILTVTMIDCEVTCTQMPKSHKEIIKNKVQLMGGLYCGDLRDSTTHLICDSTNSEKYVLAAEKGALLMLPSWIDYLFEMCKNENISCRDEAILDKYKCRVFNNLTICATGLSSSKERAKLMELIKDNGGNFTGTLVISKTDILVCYGTASTCSEKYKGARRSKRISCVTPEWIHDSVEKGYALPPDLEKYRVKAATSTPTKDGEKIDPNFSTISAVGQSICQKTTINETVTASFAKKQSYKRKADDLVEKIDIKKVKSAQHFLDGCSVFIAGFSPNCHEKLNKVINLSGATRYDEFSDRVTHVIVGDPTCTELTKIRENCDQCHLVSVQWLLDSVEQQKPAEESKYFVFDVEESEKTIRVLSEKVINVINDNKATTNESDDDELTQKYLRMAVDNEEKEDFQIKSRILRPKAQINNQSLTFIPRNTSTQISEASTDLSTEESTLNIFENLKFRLEGFSEEINKENKSLIASAGGIVVDGFFKGICNFAIVPVIYNPKEVLPALEIVNDLWLNENLENQTLIGDIKYYHRHMALSSRNILNECVVTISGYASYEREFLQTLITGLGGVFQEQFSKKTNAARNVLGSTHLISPEASGKKYEAALRWNLPVTTKDWLLACAKTGKKLPLENYLIGESEVSRQKTPPKTPVITNNFNLGSQVTPISKIVEDAVNSKILPTPATPKQYDPWDPKTPDTPLGAFYKPDPSPGLRKELQRYVNSFPDFVPPKRRISTPLSELKRRLRDKAAGRGEYSRTSQPNTEPSIENQPDLLTSLTSEITEVSQLNVENKELHQKLEKLQQMVKGSASNTPRRTTTCSNKPESSSTSDLREVQQSQPCTVSWDYDEAIIEESSKKKIFLLSAIEDRERVTNLIEFLGGQVINSSQYVPAATHLISPKPGRNEKSLSCMAAGKWILHESYLEKSAEAGHFLNEEAFEFGNPKAEKNSFYEPKDACIFRWRKEIGLRKYGAFHDMRAIIIAEKKDLISNVIQAGGGVVVNVEPPFNDPVHATHCLLEMKSIKDLSVFVPLAKQGVKCVNTIYVHDFLWRMNQNDFDYIVPYFSKYYN